MLAPLSAGHGFANECQIELSRVQQIRFSMSIRYCSFMSIRYAFIMSAGNGFSNECQIELSGVQQIRFSMCIRYGCVKTISCTAA